MRMSGLVVVLCATHALALAVEPTAADAEFFEKEIRPLLIARCYKCHGELKEPKGKLALTSRETVLAGGETGPAAVEGKPGESLLIAAVNYEGPEMPPEGNRLTAAEIAKLTLWVERGLPWPKADPESLKKSQAAAEAEQIAEARRSFWSFQPIRDVPLPTVKNSTWPQTPIDRFILAELEKRGLSPSPPADKRALLRRLTFDFVGLPPTPEEMENFLGDNSPEAVERVVDRLLTSPHYGERWGRHWLDVARYADTKGYAFIQDANFPWSYTYRDYVVRALNEDLPYDRFILEQLAADQLPLGADKRPLTALGFLTLGNAFMNNQQDVIDDRIDVVTRGLMGLTVTCARCHDHKFDPIPTKDYYSLYGVFASSVEPTIPPLFEAPPQTEAYAAFAKELADRERKLTEFLDRKYNALVEGARSRAAEYLLAANASKDRPNTEEFMLLADGNDLNPTMIIRWQVFLQRSRGRHDPVLAIWHALAALPADQFAAQAPAVVEKLIAGESPEKPLNPLVTGAFLGKPLKDLAEAARIYDELLGGADKLWRQSIDQAAAAKQPAPAALADANLERLRQVFYGPEAPPNLARSAIGDLALLPDRPAQDVHNKLVKAIEEWRANGPAAPPRAMVLEDLPSPAPSRVFLRGNPNNLGAAAPRRFLRVLSSGEPAAFKNGGGRLELAQAIVNRQNPLTARVLVNRVWLHHFGAALVHTPSDFGLRSEPPTHPELLDYLASEFIEHGWSLKGLHRQIVLSAVYQQASSDRADGQKTDPQNLWLWKMNRRRLDFEATRDALLVVAGGLENKLGGPPVKGISEPASTRRTIYAYIDRLNLPGLFRTFDFPNPDATSPERSATTVPQQALFLMNSPLVIQSAKNLLARTEVAGETDPAKKISRLYQIAFGRDPAADEIEWALEFLSAASARPALWDEFAQGLLLANEFVFID
ncbi:MAG: PSD1 domain-containing protein [Planctomycetia bacterium]|nr:PSD1 domain-containing protein [Planctomycetia bacterium]